MPAAPADEPYGLDDQVERRALGDRAGGGQAEGLVEGLRSDAQQGAARTRARRTRLPSARRSTASTTASAIPNSCIGVTSF
ncbi:hypothetical protein [Microbispora sp. GKU 823]|uniref:hypothetical protein n=1 Tax=Microbispora sp. GKU 823 TaxID=1652100 RepID=UPI002118347F|nr:hypothetical protein [Microbispora sp. GKU 823]